jgi:hypothetical protein
MEKKQVLSFNLWEEYYNFLVSLEGVYKEELKTLLAEETIYAFIESKFYNKEGGLKEPRSSDYPDSEEVHFELKDHKNFISLDFYYGNTEKAGISLGTTNENGRELLHLYSSDELASIFSPEILEAVACWLKTGELNDFAKGVVENC